ncbi:MAG TPA: hypothetical protein VD969_22140 [Symbiobacteriaceae bacterium]|nr:hypothetical protein [Symbiobacteriaceae bacterium]
MRQGAALRAGWFAAILVWLLLVPGIALADGSIAMDELSPNLYQRQYVNPSGGWRLFAAPVELLARATGVDAGTRCDGQVLTFRTKPAKATVAESFRFSLFTDVQRQHNLTDGRPVLVPVGGQSLCSDPVTAIAFNGEDVRYYTITVEPKDKTVRPGTYNGQLIISEGETERVVPVTLHVRNGLGPALLFALLGLLANWLVNRFRTRQAEIPLFKRYRRLTARLHAAAPKSPELLLQMATWIRQNLAAGTPAAYAEADKKLTFCEMLMVGTYPTWVRQLDEYLEPHNFFAWRQIQTAIEGLAADATPQALYIAVKGAVTNYNLVPVPLAAPDTKFTDSEGAEKYRVPQPDDIKGWKQWFLYGPSSSILGEWAYAGAMLLGLWVMRVGIFCAAISATVLATVAVYQKAPDFGADLLVDYGLAFAVGYAGKVFNDTLQKLAPGIASGVAVNEAPADNGK